MNFFDILLISIGFLLSLLGLIGCIVPAIPGTPLNFLALILLSFAKEWQPFSVVFLVIMAIIAVVVSILDNVIPAWGAKKYGAEKMSVWLALAGTLVGIIFFPPFGIFIGAFVGALVGELVHGKEAAAATDDFLSVRVIGVASVILSIVLPANGLDRLPDIVRRHGNNGGLMGFRRRHRRYLPRRRTNQGQGSGFCEFV